MAQQLHPPSLPVSQSSSTTLGIGNPNPNTYGYGLGGNGGNHGQSTNEIPSFIDDTDDPIALLESLTKYNSNNHATSTHSNDQFASLLQAAETAGGVDITRPQSSSNSNSTINSTPAAPIPPRKNSLKRPRDESPVEPTPIFGFINEKSRKPQKRPKLTEEEEEDAAREREIWGSEPSEAEDNEGKGIEDIITKYGSTERASLDPRANGVHSAAALFRRPGPNAKKYTRPAMSKLFASLEISPEEFITLQSAAKTYMIDEKHPERSACVGTKGGGETDMTKLKLYTCVKVFLDQEGWGEKLFGESSPSGATRKNKWPHMTNKLITLVTPLLRRMVTNERQRLYAIEQRKEKDRVRESRLSATPSQTGSPNANHFLDLPLYQGLDPSLNQLYHDTINKNRAANPTAIAKNTKVSPSQTPSQTPPLPPPPLPLAKKPGELAYHINILNDGKRSKPCITLSPLNCVGFASLNRHIEEAIDDGRQVKIIKLLTATGLVEVNDEISWVQTVLGIRKLDWMDGDVKIVVETKMK